MTFPSENETSTTTTTEASNSGGWESSMSEFETDADTEDDKEKHEKFKTMRAQHYFMSQSLRRGKELIETDDDFEEEED